MTKTKNNFFKAVLGLVLALVIAIGVVPTTPVRAESIDGGLGGSCYNQLTVWTSPSKSAVRGYVYAHEHFTILSHSGNTYHIEYSSSSGTKEGYLVGETINDWTSNTCVASVLSNTTVYYGTNSSYEAAGTVYAGEKVVVVGSDNTWDFIEYNTSSGRKRGYVLKSSLYSYNRGNIDGLSIYNFNSNYYVDLSGSTSRVVYGAPSSQANHVGSVNNADNHIYYCQIIGSSGETYWYIRYVNFSTGKYKTGYLKM